jgi:hypothetical protein
MEWCPAKRAEGLDGASLLSASRGSSWPWREVIPFPTTSWRRGSIASSIFSHRGQPYSEGPTALLDSGLFSLQDGHWLRSCPHGPGGRPQSDGTGTLAPIHINALARIKLSLERTLTLTGCAYERRASRHLGFSACHPKLHVPAPKQIARYHAGRRSTVPLLELNRVTAAAGAVRRRTAHAGPFDVPTVQTRLFFKKDVATGQVFPPMILKKAIPSYDVHAAGRILVNRPMDAITHDELKNAVDVVVMELDRTPEEAGITGRRSFCISDGPVEVPAEDVFIDGATLVRSDVPPPSNAELFKRKSPPPRPATARCGPTLRLMATVGSRARTSAPIRFHPERPSFLETRKCHPVHGSTA